jgi:parallel beta-helix repeat protein
MYFDSASQKYVEFDGIEIDAVNSPDQGVNIRNDAHHIRFRNGAVLNGQTFGILTVARSGDQNSAAFNEFLNMEVAYTAMNPDGTLRTCRAGEPPGPSYCNGIYIESSNNVFDRVHSHHNNGQGIQLYPSGNRNNIVRNSVLHDNYGNGLVSYDDDHQCINNLIYNNKRWQGLQIGGRNALVYYNTVVNNTDGGIYFWGSGHQAKNNIVYQNDGNDVEGLSLDSTNLVGTNPQFVNAANGDFRLKASSPAIDRGTFLAQVTTAIDGTPRPQGASPDIGAYEFGGSGDTTPPDPPQNARISN